MQIRRNSKIFKAIQLLFEKYEGDPDRKDKIKLFIVKPGETLADRIAIEELEKGAEFYYNINYETLNNSFASDNLMLHSRDEQPDLYYLKDRSNPEWDQLPFQLSSDLQKEIATIEIPKQSKKEKEEKEKKVNKPLEKKAKKEPPKKTTPQKIIPEKPKPLFDLKFEIEFTNLDKVVYAEAGITKKDVLNYYYDIADYILPYLKDRPLQKANSKTLNKLPAWMKTVKLKTEDDDEEMEYVICQNKEQLMYLVELGYVSFHPFLSRQNHLRCPDYLVLQLNGENSNFSMLIEVAKVSKTILDGLKLPSAIKLVGLTTFDLYVPLNGWRDFSISKKMAKSIAQLITLKTPATAYFEKSNGDQKEKVIIDFEKNEPGATFIAPFSLNEDEDATVSIPLAWSEITNDLDPKVFDIDTIKDRLNESGDPMKDFLSDPVDAEVVAANVEQVYGFLLA